MTKIKKYLVAVIGNGKTQNEAELFFFEKKGCDFLIVDKSSCFVGKNGWAKRSDIENENFTNKEDYKKEGDNKTPEGLFVLGRMFSHNIKENTTDGKEPGNNPNLYCYEDLNEVYECCIDKSPVGDRRNEEERMTNPLYKRAIFINYNYPKKNKGAGSCIFLHISDKATAGCVASNFEIIDNIFQTITPNTTPILMISNKESLKNFPEFKDLAKSI